MSQWIRICLPTRGTPVQSLVWEDSTCHGAAKTPHHDSWAGAPEPATANAEPVCCGSWSLGTQSRSSATREAAAMRSNEDPAQPYITLKRIIFNKILLETVILILGPSPELCFPEQRISGDCFGLSRAESAVEVLVAQLYPILFDPNATPWTVIHQSPVSMGFSRQEYWNGFPCPPPGDLPNPGI